MGARIIHYVHPFDEGDETWCGRPTGDGSQCVEDHHLVTCKTCKRAMDAAFEKAQTSAKEK
jgi:hypothetical protein